MQRHGESGTQVQTHAVFKFYPAAMPLLAFEGYSFGSASAQSHMNGEAAVNTVAVPMDPADNFCVVVILYVNQVQQNGVIGERRIGNEPSGQTRPAPCDHDS